MKTSERIKNDPVEHAKMWYRISVALIPVWFVLGIMCGIGVAPYL